jgi:hypothetical protein
MFTGSASREGPGSTARRLVPLPPASSCPTAPASRITPLYPSSWRNAVQRHTSALSLDFGERIRAVGELSATLSESLAGVGAVEIPDLAGQRAAREARGNGFGQSGNGAATSEPAQPHRPPRCGLHVLALHPVSGVPSASICSAMVDWDCTSVALSTSVSPFRVVAGNLLKRVGDLTDFGPQRVHLPRQLDGDYVSGGRPRWVHATKCKELQGLEL